MKGDIERKIQGKKINIFILFLVMILLYGIFAWALISQFKTGLPAKATTHGDADK